MTVYIHDRDTALQQVATAIGYRKDGGSEEMSQLTIPDPFPAIALPQGFRLKSLADGNDLRRLHRVLWRGFAHGAEPPDDRRMGLGRAEVLEGVRRCGVRGATVAYVGSATSFYRSLGFRQIYRCSTWRREWA